MKIVILGGGFGGIYTLKYLHKFFHNTDIKLVLVNKKNYFLFTPLLHEFATGSISLENLVEPIREIIKCCDYEFVHGEVKIIDLEKRIVYVDSSGLKSYKLPGLKPDISSGFKADKSGNHPGKSSGRNPGNYISYDYLVIALGAKTNFYNIPGAEENSFTLKSLDDAISLRNHFIHMFETASKDKDEGLLTFVIVGGGATGVELTAEMSDYFYKTFSRFYPKEIISKVKIILIERGNELIPQFSSKLRKIAFDILRKKNVEIILEKGVKEVGKDFIKLDDEAIIKTKTVIWTAGVEPNLPEIIGNIEKDNRGRLIVNEYLQVKNYENVFSIGDVCCCIQNQKPLPQLAQVAVKQTKTVTKNIFNLIKNRPLEKFVYRHQGDLISLGKFFAIGEIKNFTFSGFFAWILWRGVYLSKMISNKDKIKTFIDWLLNFFYPRDITEI